MKRKNLLLVFLLVFVGILIPMSEISAAYSRWSTTSGKVPDPDWLIKVHELGIYLDYENGKVQGFVDFTIRATQEWTEVCVDKVYLWVDTQESSPKTWTKTCSYKVAYGESSERHRFTTAEINTGVKDANAYSCTIWIRFKENSGPPFSIEVVKLYLAHRPLFYSAYNYYAIAASPDLEVFSSQPPNAPI